MLYFIYCYYFYYFFFFKQKTAYEMRISDWSSDVCSSDLTIYSLVNRIATLPQAGRPKEALAMLDTVLPTAREVLGDRHPQTQAAMQFLAEDSDAVGDTPRAIATYRELLAAREASLGADDWRTVDTAWQLEGLLIATRASAAAATIKRKSRG